MKAVVLEKKGNEAVILKEDGTIDKINRICEVGEEIIVNDTAKIVKFTKKYIAIAASFALALILGISGYVYAAPTSYVTMDAKLSFEFALNAFDEVVSMTSLSAEGEKIATDYNNLSSFHPSINEAVALTSELLYNANYLGNDDTQSIIISAVSNNDEKSILLVEQAKTAADEVGSKYGSTTDIATAIGSQETRNQATSEGKSTGQYIKDNSKNNRSIQDTTIIGDSSTNSTVTASDSTNTTVANTTSQDVTDDSSTNSTIEDSEEYSTPAEDADSGKKSDYSIADDDKNSTIIADDKKNVSDTEQTVVEASEELTE